MGENSNDNTTYYRAQVDAATKKIDLFTIEPKLHKELAAILITELVCTKHCTKHCTAHCTLHTAHCRCGERVSCLARVFP